MGIQAKNIPEKICDKRKTQWNGITVNNNLHDCNFLHMIRFFFYLKNFASSTWGMKIIFT